MPGTMAMATTTTSKRSRASRRLLLLAAASLLVAETPPLATSLSNHPLGAAPPRGNGVVVVGGSSPRIIAASSSSSNRAARGEEEGRTTDRRAFPEGRTRRLPCGVLLASATASHDRGSNRAAEGAFDSSTLPDDDDDDDDDSAAERSTTGSTAVILNMNARSVTPELASVASEVFGEENVFVTRTREDAILAARTVVRGCPSAGGYTSIKCDDDDEDEGDGDDDGNGDGGNPRRYSLVVPVGGDGTLSGWIDTMVDEILLLHRLEREARDGDDESAAMSVEEAVKQLPMIGYVPMGTGNGLGYVIGCKAGKSKDDEGGGVSSRRSILSRLNVLGRLKRRKLDRTRRVMTRLRGVGDSIQEAERTRRRQRRTRQQLHVTDALAGRCTVVEMPLMEVTHPSSSSDPAHNVEEKGDLCFFGGAGFDSLMLHDFQQIKAWSKSSKSAPAFVRDALSSVAGYCVALVTRTLPQALRHGTHRIHVEVTTTDEGTLWVDHRRGDFSELAVTTSATDLGGSSQNGTPNGARDGTSDPRARRRKHLIYSGTTGIVAASTTPYYGGGLRLFPYARLFPDRLQLRLGRISPLTGFLNIPSIFEGSYRERGEGSFGCLDFVGKEFEVEVRGGRYEEHVGRRREEKRRRKEEAAGGDEEEEEGQTMTSSRGFPFQHSGESMGIKERFRLRVVPEPVRFVSFLEPRVVVDD